MEVEQKRHKSIKKRLREKISFLTLKIIIFYGSIQSRIVSPESTDTEMVERQKLVDRASAVITAAMLLIILVLFIVASVKLGLTFSSIYNDFKTFFYGT